jgi:hypothetical protein
MMTIPFIPTQWRRPPKPTKNEVMLNKKEVLARIGVAPTNAIKEEVFAELRKYQNPFNTQKMYKSSEVDDLIASFKTL